MKAKQLISAATLTFLQAALMCWLMLAPFAWILRDGMGPDSVETQGLTAVLRALTTFHWGPVFLALAAASWLFKARAPLPDPGWERRWALIGAVGVLTVAVSFILMSGTL